MLNIFPKGLKTGYRMRK